MEDRGSRRRLSATRGRRRVFFFPRMLHLLEGDRWDQQELLALLAQVQRQLGAAGDPPPAAGAALSPRGASMKKWRIVILGLARRDRKGSLNDGRIQNSSNPYGIVPLSNFVPRGFGFVHHSIALLYHAVPNLISRFATFSSQYAGGTVARGPPKTPSSSAGW